MAVNKFGIGSLVLGILILAAVWMFQFAGAGNVLMAVLSFLFWGGLLWIGAFLVLIGILMLIL